MLLGFLGLHRNGCSGGRCGRPRSQWR